MEKALNNVAKLPVNSIYEDIRTYIENLGLSSENTEREYLGDITLFFSYVRNKRLEELTIEDFNFRRSEIVAYQNWLSKERGYKNITVNRKINTISSLLKYLQGDYPQINPAVTKVNRLPDDSKTIGFLSPDEAKHLAYLALTTEREKGKMKSALILLAASTSMRKEAILNLKFSDIKPDPTDSSRYLIEVEDKSNMDKGSKIYKEIHKSLFDMLLEIKEDDDDDKIFHIYNDAITNMMRRLCAKAGIDPKRNISFHSLKKAGVQFAYDIGGLLAAQHQAGHSSPVVTEKFYLQKQKNLAGMGMFEDISEDVFDQLSRDEMLKLLKGVGNGLGYQLRRSAYNIVQNRS